MKAILFLFCSQLFTVFCTWAQPSQNSRAELPYRNDFTQYEIFPQPDSTLFLLTHENYTRRNADPFLIFKFDHNLTLLWQKPLHLPRSSKFLQAACEARTLFLFFDGAKKDEYVLLRVHTRTGEQTQTKHQLPENMTFALSGMQALQGSLFLTGLQNDRLTVLHLNPDREELMKLPAIYDQSSALATFYADTLTGRMEFILTESNGLKARLQTKRLGPDGRLFSTNFLQSPEHNYLSGRLTPGDSTRKLLAGTYSLRDLRYPQGFFTGPFLTTGNQHLKYHDFTTFAHFFDHLRPGRQERVRRKLDRFRISRKTYLLRQRFLMHEMYPLENGFILAGELYYPQYEGEGSTNRVFSGYAFSQAVAAAFDSQGNLQWENSFPLENVQQLELKQITAAGVFANKIAFCYPDEEMIRYKVISGNENSSNELSTPVKLIFPNEKILNTDLRGIKHWHRQHFLVFGEQKIRGSDGVRTVFFLNKLSF
ncbi:hypothetical protein I5M27_14200 [Adhaeribacter sp. BT258]|uniref:Uncharacterized protein n=1 Tax=Adhaeribacter terrigena TaxID=2793070 RepID=A0ABS1C419_9BACT|nr:hypothetical protein [Adhaeribacter terrigena]MBK0404143.1 hypothetical protein [Adhaeribacter terrigena]